METQRGHVACRQDGFPVHFHAKGMGGIVDDFQPVFVGYRLDTFHVAGLAIHMHGHDGRGLGGDGSLYLVRVKVARFRVDVHKHRLDAVPPQGMGGGHKAVRGGNDFARNAQHLQSAHQRQRAVGEQADIGDFQILAQGFLQLLVVMAVIGQPLAVPDIPQVRQEIIQGREQGRSNRNYVLFHVTVLIYVLKKHTDTCLVSKGKYGIRTESDFSSFQE